MKNYFITLIAILFMTAMSFAQVVETPVNVAPYDGEGDVGNSGSYLFEWSVTWTPGHHQPYLYEIQISTNATFEFGNGLVYSTDTFLYSSNPTSYTVNLTGLNVNTTYYWRVFSQYQDVAYSIPTSFTTGSIFDAITAITPNSSALVTSNDKTTTFYWQYTSTKVNTPITFHLKVATDPNDMTGSAVMSADYIKMSDNSGYCNVNADFDISNLHTNTTYYWGLSINADIVSNIQSFTTGDVLPVQLNSFNASVKNNIVNLSWSTATEVNNYGFDIERSSDNKTYDKIGFVKGSGNSNSAKNYSFTDQPDGTSFSYKIKQINNDGTFVYSDAITVTLKPGNSVQLMNNYPNPFNPSTAIKFYIPDTRNVSITIYDMLGREVTTLFNTTETAGYHMVYWNGKDNFGSSVASGIYLYKIQAGNFTDTRKMNLLK